MQVLPCLKHKKAVEIVTVFSQLTLTPGRSDDLLSRTAWAEDYKDANLFSIINLKSRPVFGRLPAPRL
jgi:hypothetical protein